MIDIKLFAILILAVGLSSPVRSINYTEDGLASNLLLSILDGSDPALDMKDRGAMDRMSEIFWESWHKSHQIWATMSRINPELRWMSPGENLAKVNASIDEFITAADLSVGFSAQNFEPPTVNLASGGYQHGGKLISQCNSDLLHMVYTMATIAHHTGDKMWLIQMLDAMSKPGPGLARGNYQLVGDYGECLAARTNYSWTPFGSRYEIKGRYCKISLGPTDAQAGLPVGLCLPASCTSEEINSRMDMVTNFLREIPIIGSKIPDRLWITAQCLPLDEERSLGASGIMFLVVIGIILMLNATGTGIDLSELYSMQVKSDPTNPKIESNAEIESKPSTTADVPIEITDPAPLPPKRKIRRTVPEPVTNQPEGIYAFLACWSIYRNSQPLIWSYVDSPPKTKAQIEADQSKSKLPKLEQQDINDPLKLDLESLYGIRFGSMLWVMTYHAFLLPLIVSNNILDFWDAMQDSWSFQAVMNSTASCDSFFVLSGFLLTYMFFRRGGSGGRTWLHYYVHRYWRLTPVYGLTIWFVTSIMWRIGEGPLWDYGNALFSPARLCTKYWWTNLLYINNVKTTSEQECIPWTWYLANDMQFYWVAPIYLILLKWRPAVGLAALVLSIAASTGGTFAISYVNNYWPFMSTVEFKHAVGNLSNMDVMMIQDEFDELYQAPWVRIVAYLIGLLFGYAMATIPARHFKPLLHPLTVVVGWIVSLMTMIAVIYGIYGSDDTMTVTGAAFYTALSRPVWSVALCWVIFATTAGQGGPITVLLSYTPIVRLSKISYVAYLIHPLLIVLVYFNNKTPYHFTYANAVMYYGGLVAWTHLFAALIHLLVEQPFLAIERWFLRVIK